MVYLQGIVYNYLFGAICLLFNFFYGGFCCEQLSSISWIPGEFDRVTKVVNNAWKHCRVQITEECSKNIGYNQFCAEQFCEFNYEELESLKPQKQCQPVRHSLNRLCKLLFIERCSSSISSNARGIRALIHKSVLFSLAIINIPLIII